MSVVAIEVAGEYMVSEAFFAVTSHVPISAATTDLFPDKAHPAVPAFVMTYVSSPVPEPPVVIKANKIPWLPEIEVITSGV